MWVKICGLTTVENALQVCEAGVDSIGLNFYAKSKRCVDLITSREIVEALPVDVEPVGLFVNHTLEEIRTITNKTGIKTVQLHGDETAEFAAQLDDLKIIRAFRIDETNIANLAGELDRFQVAGVKLYGCLIDAKADGAYGGTGHLAPWELISKQYIVEEWPPLVLAGGLTTENIKDAIDVVHPWGVDTASGVESFPGVKDPKLVQQFVSLSKQESL